MIRSVSLDSDNTLYVLGTSNAISHLANYLASLFGASNEFWEAEYQRIRYHVRTNEWQTSRCYDIHYRLGILFRKFHLPIEKLDGCTQEYYKAEIANTQFFPEALESIRELKKIYKVGITTDSPLVSTQKLSPCIQKSGVTREDLDFLIFSEHSKRTGIPFDILIKEMQMFGILPYEIVHIGDNPESDINPAQERKINTILFDPRKSSFSDLIESIDNIK